MYYPVLIGFFLRMFILLTSFTIGKVFSFFIVDNIISYIHSCLFILGYFFTIYSNKFV